MDYIKYIINLIARTAFMNLTPSKSYNDFCCLYIPLLAIKKGFELRGSLLPSGIYVTCIYPDIMIKPENSKWSGGLLHCYIFGRYIAFTDYPWSWPGRRQFRSR